MNNRLSDEDRAYTARMLGGCGWYVWVGLWLFVFVVIPALVAWAVLS